jgi:hypothetical protein
MSEANVDPVEQAVRAAGEEYERAEEALLAAGAAAVPLLEARAKDRDPVTRLLVRELIARLGEGDRGPRRGALLYLDAAARFFDDTPGKPRADMIGPDVAERYGPEPAVYLALRLLKSEGWPLWKGSSVLEYLRIVRVPATTAILIRFALQTGNRYWRIAALLALQTIADPAFETKLAEEKAWRNGALVWPPG